MVCGRTGESGEHVLKPVTAARNENKDYAMNLCQLSEEILVLVPRHRPGNAHYGNAQVIAFSLSAAFIITVILLGNIINLDTRTIH